MPVEHFITYKGQHYDVGTRLKFRAFSWGYYQGVKVGVIEEFIKTTAYIRADDGEIYQCSTITNDWVKNIIEIIYPVYYVEKEPQNNGRVRPPDWQIEMGVTWYIIIMVFCALFKERWLGWFCVTGYFLLWINGFLNGGKK
jgi:hypothetical protein